MLEREPIIQTLVTIRDYLRWGASRFKQAELVFGHGTDNALDEAAALVLHVVHYPEGLAEKFLGAVLTVDEREQVVNLIERRISERTPAAYLTGEAMFAGRLFSVDERVLVPRSPIAELIEQRFSPWVNEHEVGRVLDLGTGSGCIAVACAEAFPSAIVDAVDISVGALEVAGNNVRRYDLETRVNLLESDLFAELSTQRYDLIVSNPPYVNREEFRNLAPEYHCEPQIGFDGGECGLVYIEQILRDAARHLTDKGVLVVEVGSSAQALQDKYPDTGFVWLDFERGGDGVFLLTVDQCTSELLPLNKVI